jgi:hypothetical protein
MEERTRPAPVAAMSPMAVARREVINGSGKATTIATTCAGIKAEFGMPL